MDLNEQLITELADLVGFHRSYTDSFGKTVTAKKPAIHALLTAMGYRVDEPKILAQQITELREKSWRTMLPSSVVLKAEEPNHQLMISLPKVAANQLVLTFAMENGDQHTSNIAVDQLKVLDHIQLVDQQFVKYQLPLEAMADGYHQLTVTCGQQQACCHVIVAPKTCYSPQEAAPEKMWGYAAQLYSLRSDTNWGMGDFGDLNKLVAKSAQLGASAIGLNPLHPLYQNNPAHRSPYSPTSRCFLNSLYIDVTLIPNFVSCELAQQRVNTEEFQEKIKIAKQATLIDYPAVAAVKFEIIELLYQDFISKSSTNYAVINEEFCEFKQQQGEDLQRLSTFDALFEYFRAKDCNVYGWPQWPEAYQQVDSEAVKQFQHTYAQRIDYFSFLQWLAHKQLSRVAQTAEENGMPIGLYLDLAVGCDGSGVDVWSDQALYVSGAAVGAPPDAMNTLGQDWGLTPLNPVALQAQGYQPLVKALRSNMQYAGALRIDHILGLMRQYWVAPGMKANEGVYITFPLAEILRIIALESRRNNCVVIGEDLGTVPEGFGEIMHNAGLLSYKVLFFERWESGLFKRPELYCQQSMVTVSTHDLPTLTGWWTGRDLQWRQQLNLYPNEHMGQDERNSRVEDRALLLSALNDLQVIDMAHAPSQAPAKMATELTIAVQRYLAQAPSHIQLIPLEDTLELVEQVNIPGTIDEHPNWRQKLPVSMENFWQQESVVQLANSMQQARPRHKELTK